MSYQESHDEYISNMRQPNEEDLGEEYFEVASNVFDSLEHEGVRASIEFDDVVSMDPDYLDEMAVYFNEKSKEFLQAILYLERSSRESAQACVAIAEQLRTISEYNTNQGECSD